METATEIASKGGTSTLLVTSITSLKEGSTVIIILVEVLSGFLIKISSDTSCPTLITLAIVLTFTSNCSGATTFLLPPLPPPPPPPGLVVPVPPLPQSPEQVLVVSPNATWQRPFPHVPSVTKKAENFEVLMSILSVASTTVLLT